MANILPRDQQITVISALSECMSIRSVERLTGIRRDTIMRLGARVGRDRGMLHDVMVRDLPATVPHMMAGFASHACRSSRAI
jgi:hypothetical protein